LSPYDAGTRTPIFVRWPGQIAARRDDSTLASSIDIAPTILQACGVKPAAPLPGIALTDRARIEARKAIFGSIFVHTSISVDNPVENLKYRWVIRGRHKLIAPYQRNLKLPVWEGQPHQYWADRDELYDVLADPAEKTNLASKQPALAAELKSELDRWWQAGG
jgi:uncharacterized sulfatase